jgi:hypothetical protein
MSARLQEEGRLKEEGRLQEEVGLGQEEHDLDKNRDGKFAGLSRRRRR